MHDDHNSAVRRAKQLMLALIAVIMLLCTVLFGLALEVQAPQSIHEGEPLLVNATGAGNVTIYREGILVASAVGAVSYRAITDSTSAGSHNFTLSDAQTNGSVTITVTDVPLQISVVSPSTDAITTDITYALTTNWVPELCYVQIDGAGHTLTSINDTAFSEVLSTADGVHTIDFKCRLNGELAVQTRTLHVDAHPPRVTATSPSGDVSGQYVTLSVDTDEIAQCRYAETDTSFATMSASFGSTYATKSTVTIPITRQGPYTYFVRCKDVYGGVMETSAIISFLAKLPPSASIALNGAEPYKAGTYEVKLKSSVPLLSMPKLTYLFQESGRQQQVALSGSGDEWTGFFIVPADLSDTVVSFTFSGQSREGVAGTELTSKSIFTIDALAPAPVDAITVDNSSSGIKLRWFSTDASEISSYNIYRADHEGVTYTDSYASAQSTEFTDNNAQGARYYYYRVAPVDAAGNIGALSSEVYGSALEEKLKLASAADPLQAARIDDMLATLNAAMFDVNATLSALEGEGNAVIIQVISDMDLVGTGKAARSNLEAAAVELATLRDTDPTTADVDAAIQNARDAITQARQTLIKRIVPQEQTNVEQPSDIQGLERGLPYAVSGKEMPSSERDEYLGRAKSLQDKISVYVEATSFRMYDLTGTQRDYTFVRKRVTSSDPTNEVSVIEHIPKTVASHASDIVFSDEPEVLEDDPVIKYSVPVLEQHVFTYLVKGIIPLDEVKKSRTFVYPSMTVPSTQTLVTGNATTDMPFVPSTDMVLIAVGVLVIIALGAYYVSLNNDQPFRGPLAKEVRRVIKRQQPPAQVIVRRPLIRTTPRPAPVDENPLDDVHLPPTPDGLRAMLADAELRIDEKRYDAAMQLYADVLTHLKKDVVLEQQLHEQTMQVYAKLLLFKRLNDAGAAVEAKDLESLKAALADVHQIAEQLGEQPTVLITEAKSSYASFMQALNRMEIEHAGKY